MSGVLLGMLAETHIHVGIGQAEGAIDLPVAREGGSDHPFASGTGVKGSLRETVVARGYKTEATRWFGQEPRDPENEASRQGGAANGARADNGQGAAGEVLVGDMRLLLLPVRSLTHFYMWLTCPYLIERYQRDRARLDAGRAVDFDWSKLDGSSSDDVPNILTSGNGQVYLEERLFNCAPLLPNNLIDLLAPAIAWPDAKARLERQVAVVSDRDFSWFARSALPVTARNELDKDTKTSTNLWYEECLPPDTVMTLTLVDRCNNGAAQEVADLFKCKEGVPYLRVGGNETVGQGWFNVCCIAGDQQVSGGPTS